MATNENKPAAPTGDTPPAETPPVAPIAFSDADIYMSVEGWIGVLPVARLANLSDAAKDIAIREGCKQLALRKAQTVAKNATKAGKPVREAINEFLATFEPAADTEFQTLGTLRNDIAKEYATERLAAAKFPTDEATVAKTAAAMLTGTDEKAAPHRAAIAERFAKRLEGWTKPSKRNTDAKGDGTAVDLGALA